MRVYTINNEPVLAIPSINCQANNRRTLSLEISDLKSAVLSIGAVVKVVDGSVTLFEGLLLNFSMSQTGNRLFYKISATDYTFLAEKRVFKANLNYWSNASRTIITMINEVLKDEGVTCGNSLTGGNYDFNEDMLVSYAYSHSWISDTGLWNSILQHTAVATGAQVKALFKNITGSGSDLTTMIVATMVSLGFISNASYWIEVCDGTTTANSNYIAIVLQNASGLDFDIDYGVDTDTSSYLYLSCAEVLNQLADASDCVWWIDDDKGLHFQKTSESYIQITDSSWIEGFTVSEDLAGYKNTMYLLGNPVIGYILKGTNGDTITNIGTYDCFEKLDNFTTLADLTKYAKSIIKVYGTKKQAVNFNLICAASDIAQYLVPGASLNINRTLFGLTDAKYIINGVNIRLFGDLYQLSISAADKASKGGWENYYKKAIMPIKYATSTDAESTADLSEVPISI